MAERTTNPKPSLLGQSNNQPASQECEVSCVPSSRVTPTTATHRYCPSAVAGQGRKARPQSPTLNSHTSTPGRTLLSPSLLRPPDTHGFNIPPPSRPPSTHSFIILPVPRASNPPPLDDVQTPAATMDMDDFNSSDIDMGPPPVDHWAHLGAKSI